MPPPHAARKTGHGDRQIARWRSPHHNGRATRCELSRPPANRHARNAAVSTRRLFAWAARIAVRHAIQNIGSWLPLMRDNPFRASQNRPNRERAGRFDGAWQKGGGTLQKRMPHISTRRCGDGGAVCLDLSNQKSLRVAGGFDWQVDVVGPAGDQAASGRAAMSAGRPG